jgi:poly(3-hydroxybutyrate) depolymerase
MKRSPVAAVLVVSALAAVFAGLALGQDEGVLDLGRARRMIAAGRADEAKPLLEGLAGSQSDSVRKEAAKALEELDAWAKQAAKTEKAVNAISDLADLPENASAKPEVGALLARIRENIAPVDVGMRWKTLERVIAQAPKCPPLESAKRLWLAVAYGDSIAPEEIMGGAAELCELESRIHAAMAPGDRLDADSIAAVNAQAAKSWKFIEAVVARGWFAAEASDTWTPFIEEFESPDPATKGAVCVCLPTGYTPAKPWPLLLALHWTYGDGPEFLDWWMKCGKDQGYIIVAPSAEGETENGWCGKEVRRQFVMAALGHVMDRYNVDANRVYVSGYSMGGHASWEYPAEFPDVFAGSVAMAGRPVGMVRDRFENLAQIPFMTIFGEKDMIGPKQGIAGANREGLEILKKLKADVTAVERKGEGHALNLAEADFLRIYDWMQTKVRAPHPKSVKLVCRDECRRRAYWLEPLKIVVVTSKTYNTPSGGAATLQENPIPLVTGRMLNNEISVTSRHVRELRVFLTPRLIDPAKPVRIEHGGKIVLKTDFSFDFGFLLKEARRRSDRAMLFWNFLDVKID